MRILWLKTELLHPVDKGGKIRTYAMLRELAKEHEVTYLTLDDGDAAPDAVERATEYCTRLERVPFSPAKKGSARFYAELAGNLFSGLPYALSRYRSAEFEQRVAELAGSGDYDVVVCDFLTPAVNLPSRLPVPVVLFQHNVEAEIWRRHVEVRRDPISRAYFAEQYRRMRRFEAEACRRFDLVIAVSEEDARHFEREYGLSSVAHVPTGVDTEFFTSAAGSDRRAGNLVFTGSMDWMPNEDGIRWFTDEILARIRREVPEVSLTVVGRNPPASVRALAERDHAVEVTGRVPDVRPYLEQGAVFIVPLRVGGGTRLKIYEGMSMGLPVVSTAVGAEGLPLRDGEHILLADDPESFAAACIRLLGDQRAAGDLAARGTRYVRERFGWRSVAARFAELCETVRPDEPVLAASASLNHATVRE